MSWAGDDDGLPAPGFVRPSRSRARRSQLGGLPPEIEQAIWRGTDLGSQTGPVVASGFAELDAVLPGGGWPCQAISEVLSPQPSVLEWRIVGPALRRVVAGGGKVVVAGPPKTPHLPGLRHSGIDERHLIWVRADTPAERLWCAEQLIKSGSCGALLAWLPQARPEQIRRLQVGAQACDGPVFVFRPPAAQHEASAAPLRVMVTFGLDWEIRLQVLKRKGAAHDGLVRLRSVPGGLEAILTPRLQTPSRLIAARASRGSPPCEAAPAIVSQAAGHALGRTAATSRP
jgi:protein ImuA